MSKINSKLEKSGVIVGGARDNAADTELAAAQLADEQHGHDKPRIFLAHRRVAWGKSGKSLWGFFGFVGLRGFRAVAGAVELVSVMVFAPLQEVLTVTPGYPRQRAANFLAGDRMICEGKRVKEKLKIIYSRS